MRQVWKFDLLPDAQTVRMPRGARLLSVACQRGVRHGVIDRLEPGLAAWGAEGPRVWALVDPYAELADRKIVVCGTGQALPDAVDGAAFVGTLLLHGDHLVFHVFDLGEVG